MKKILCAFFILLYSTVNTFATIDYEEKLLSFSAGKIVQDKIDPIINNMSESQLVGLNSKVKTYVDKYSNDAFYFAVFQYIELKTADILGINPSELNEVQKVVLECPTSPSYDYQSGLESGWVIPNICDTSLPDGIYRGENHSNGQVAREIPILDGRYNGEAKWYYANGVIQAKGNYDYGKIVGDYSWYSELGVLTQKNSYYEDGKVEVKYYYANGLVSSLQETMNGRNYGLFETYYSNGSKRHSSESYDGIPSGDLYTWYKNGEIQTHISQDNIIHADNPTLKIQEGDRVVLYTTVFNSETNEVIASNYGAYLEELIQQGSMSDILYNALVGLEESGELELISTAQELFPEMGADHPWYNMSLKYDIFVLEINR